MTKLEEIKKSVARLGKRDVKRFVRWFDEHQADGWDRQIEEDAKAGRLDKLAAQARADLAAGNVRPL